MGCGGHFEERVSRKRVCRLDQPQLYPKEETPPKKMVVDQK